MDATSRNLAAVFGCLLLVAGIFAAVRAEEPEARPKTVAGPEQTPGPLDTRVTVQVKSAPLPTFLDTISAQAKVNFIITEGLEDKRVTAFLTNVTAREALQILLEIKGLTYQRVGRSNTFVVSKRSASVPSTITRVYAVKHISLDPPESILEVLHVVLTKEHGRVAAYPPTKSIVISDLPEVFPQVEQILAELDREPVK